jgi:hypothetical protein
VALTPPPCASREVRRGRVDAARDDVGDHHAEGGLLRAIVSDNLQQARKLALTNSLLCGEIKARPPAGFDYGNSPAEFSGLSFKGKSAVLFTTNGTRALTAAAQAPVVFAAALTNRRAAASRLLDEAAKRYLDAAVMCAGVERGTAFSLRTPPPPARSSKRRASTFQRSS